MKGRLIKIINSEQWIVLYKDQLDETTYRQFVYLLHPDSISNGNVNGSRVNFSVVDGYAKLMN
jgi:hypothetical protein